MARWILCAICAVWIAGGTVGCAKREVTRLDPGTVTDLSGRWNDTDSRLVAEQMIGSSLEGRWLADFHRRSGRNPVVIAGSIRNNTTEHINVRTFLNDLQRAFVNSGQVQVVADAGERDQVRDERLDQLENADPETVKRLGRELGADYMLVGEINSILDQEEGARVAFYQIDLKLFDIETNLLTWTDVEKIKKGITRGRFKP